MSILDKGDFGGSDTKSGEEVGVEKTIRPFRLDRLILNYDPGM